MCKHYTLLKVDSCVKKYLVMTPVSCINQTFDRHKKTKSVTDRMNSD